MQNFRNQKQTVNTQVFIVSCSKTLQQKTPFSTMQSTAAGIG